VRFARTLTLGLVTLMVAIAALVTGLAWHDGYRIYIVHTGSMSPTLRPGDAVLDRPEPRAIHPGDVVTFRIRSGPDPVVTHRVASLAGVLVRTKGDANRTVDPWVLKESQIVGSTMAKLPRIGYLIFYLEQPRGLASVITIFVGLFLLWQLFFPAGEANATPTAQVRARHG
jgi:signal peptidase